MVRGEAGQVRAVSGTVASGQWSPGTGPGARGTSGQLPDTQTRPRLMTRGLASGHLVTNDIHLWVLFLLCQASSSTPLSSPHSVDISDNTLAK